MIDVAYLASTLPPDYDGIYSNGQLLVFILAWIGVALWGILSGGDTFAFVGWGMIACLLIAILIYLFTVAPFIMLVLVLIGLVAAAVSFLPNSKPPERPKP